MVQGLLWSHARQIFGRRLTERAARRGEDQPRHFLAQAGAETLMGAVVLAVDRDQLGAGCPRGADNQFAARDQDFLVGETNPFR